MGASRQPALGRDHGPVAVAQLAHRAVAPVARRTRAATDDRRVVASGDQRGPARSGPGARAQPYCERTRRRAAALPSPLHAARIRLRTNGQWTAATPPPARRCSPATRIWHSAFPASGTWRGSRHRTACWPAPPRPACRSWCSATTARSPGPSPPPAPTCRTCSSKRRLAMASTRLPTARVRSPCARSGSRSAASPTRC